jgi:hypothetical protein
MPHLEAAQSVDFDQRRWDDATDPAGFHPTSYQAEIPSGLECGEGLGGKGVVAMGGGPGSGAQQSGALDPGPPIGCFLS